MGAEKVYDYKNFGVLENYVLSFSSKTTDNIETTREKTGMIFPPHLIDTKQSTCLCKVLETGMLAFTISQK